MAIQSPFPGMDPYLEQNWQDVHQRLVVYGCDQLQEHLPSSLRARADERDVEEPMTIQLESEPVTESFIEIVEAGSGHCVVTVIEVLSPSNKTSGEGRDLYLRKQEELRQGGVSLVEIDLLRAGDHVLAVPYYAIPEPHRTATYKICVRRGWEPHRFLLYPFGLQRRLPTIKVPLRQSDAEVPLNLQALIEQAYRNGRYDDLDYSGQPDPPLTGEDAAWADELLRSKGLR